jgi:hypothetical protein
MGARPNPNGLDATHCHMTNGLNTSVEALEHTYPQHITRINSERPNRRLELPTRGQLASESEITSRS